MSCIVFYEKPGCTTNKRQKRLLRSAGLELEERNLLDEPWTRERLRPFFGARPVAEWFNPSAPAIKHGELDPHALGDEEALALMLEQPLLIRRPLLSCGARFMVGFDPVALGALLPGDIATELLRAPMEGCSHEAGGNGHCQPPGGSR
ncbi:ArsC/Spx/MgsR family protein [Billgrantia endophytica]|uniref:Arsenate reductase family protein n=1 Tax=Billgrantia endophytica TaxID=2033802 RepID=A0A2N7U004_9GAMM|nr:ArsC/Spx/MgsR family protein [Halomonas endophytica]PMR73766.1 arsenate reductase family protein [Halomonas endophytica]